MNWISVKDKLPEHGQQVLACSGSSMDLLWFHVWENGPSFSRSNEFRTPVEYWGQVPIWFHVWEHGPSFSRSDEFQTPVEYWMPVPELPPRDEE